MIMALSRTTGSVVLDYTVQVNTLCVRYIKQILSDRQMYTVNTVRGNGDSERHHTHVCIDYTNIVLDVIIDFTPVYVSQRHGTNNAVAYNWSSKWTKDSNVQKIK